MGPEERLRFSLTEIARRKEEERCRYFVPHEGQRKAIQRVGEGKHLIYLISTGNWWGKTATVMNIAANVTWGPQSKWFNYPIFEKWPYPKRGRIITESKNVDEIGAIDEEIRVWWPKNRYQGSKGGRQYISTYKTDTDWIWDKMTYEQDPKEFEASTIGIQIFDEPPPRPIFYAALSRMKRGAIFLISMTSLAGAEWIFEEGGLLDNEDVCVIYGDIEENCSTHGRGGVLEHANIEKMLSSQPKEEREARKTGKPLQMMNTIFGGLFVPEVHIIEDNIGPPAGSQFGMTADPADGKPYAIGWWWVDPRGHLVFDNCWPEEPWVKLLRDRKPLPKMEEYLPIFKQYEVGRRMEWRILDRHFGRNRNVLTGKTLIEDWRDLYGIEFEPSYDVENEMTMGIMKVNEYLRFDKDRPLNGMNLPRIYVKRRCKNIITSLEKWGRKVDPAKFVSVPDRDSPYKDFCDVVRYTCMKQPEVYVSRPFQQNTPGYVLGR